MKKIILKSNYTGHQKLMLFFIFFVTFFVGGSYLLITILDSSFLEKEHIIYRIVIPSLFPFSFYALILFFSKQGIIVDGNNLYYSKFCFGKPFHKKAISLEGAQYATILTYDIQQKLAFFSAARPDLAAEHTVKRIFLLNELHTKKTFLIETRYANEADKVLGYLAELLHLESAIYRPPRARRRRR